MPCYGRDTEGISALESDRGISTEEGKEKLRSAPLNESVPRVAEVPSVLMILRVTIVDDKVKRQLPAGRFAENAEDSHAHLCEEMVMHCLDCKINILVSAMIGASWGSSTLRIVQ